MHQYDVTGVLLLVSYGSSDQNLESNSLLPYPTLHQRHSGLPTTLTSLRQSKSDIKPTETLLESKLCFSAGQRIGLSTNQHFDHLKAFSTTSLCFSSKPPAFFTHRHHVSFGPPPPRVLSRSRRSSSAPLNLPLKHSGRKKLGNEHQSDQRRPEGLPSATTAESRRRPPSEHMHQSLG